MTVFGYTLSGLIAGGLSGLSLSRDRFCRNVGSLGTIGNNLKLFKALKRSPLTVKSPLGVNTRTPFLFVLAGCALLSAQGCSSIVLNGPTASSQEISTERKALRVAAQDVTAVNWPKPTARSSFGFGFGASSGEVQKITKRDAVDAYAALLAEMGDPKDRLVEDAQTHLVAADILVRAVERTALFDEPEMSDVAVVEDAIGALREAKEVYIATLKVVVDDEKMARFVGRGLKTDFLRAIRDVGDAADLLADKIADNRRQTLAEQNRFDQRLSGYFNGSL